MKFRNWLKGDTALKTSPHLLAFSFRPILSKAEALERLQRRMGI